MRKNAIATPAERGLGSLLVERGWISASQLSQGLKDQQEAGGHLGTCLLERDSLPESRLLQALSILHSNPAAAGSDLRSIPPEVRSLIPRQIALRHRVVPFRMVGGEVWTATLAITKARKIGLEQATGYPQRLHICTEVRIAEALAGVYGSPLDPRLEKLLSVLASRQTQFTASDLFSRIEENRRFTRKNTSQVSPELEPLSLQEFHNRLQVVDGPDAVGTALVSTLSRYFTRIALLRVDGDQVRGWLGAGRQINEQRLFELRIPFDEPSLFLNLKSGSGFHLGPMPAMNSHRRLAACWSGELPPESLLLPVSLQDRIVLFVYGDREREGLADLPLAELQGIVGDAEKTLLDYLKRKKLRKA